MAAAYSVKEIVPKPKLLVSSYQNHSADHTLFSYMGDASLMAGNLALRGTVG